MNLRIFDSLAEAGAACERAILQRIAQGDRTIALSGGSSPKPLYVRLGQNDSIRELPMTWVVVDERYVPVDDPQSNAGMMQKTLFAKGLPPAHKFLHFRTEAGDPSVVAREFEREWRSHHLKALDLVLLGMGDDGHTASLFPGTTSLDVLDRIATEVYVPKMAAWRITLTQPLLRQAKLRFVLLAGESKAPILRAMANGADFPIKRVTDGVDTWWFADRAAAGDLEA